MIGMADYGVHVYFGNMEIVQLMIEKGATDWDGGLEGACSGGIKSAVLLMIAKGADYCRNCGKSMEEHN